jgi:hypothetical protein
VRIRPLLSPPPPSSSSSPGEDGGEVGEDGGGGDRARDLRPRAYALATDAENSVVVVVPPPSYSHSHWGDHGDATPAQWQRQRQQRYAYDRVYGESSDTYRLYVEMVSDIVRSVTGQGRDGTVFTYGQTSTGE